LPISLSISCQFLSLTYLSPISLSLSLSHQSLFFSRFSFATLCLSSSQNSLSSLSFFSSLCFSVSISVSFYFFNIFLIKLFFSKTFRI
jgi:hypothetical protein